MQVNELKIFFSGIRSYFVKTTGNEADLGVPYIAGDDLSLLDYTGLITVFGQRKGCLYITCNQQMLFELSKIMLNKKDPSEQAVKALAGELINIIAGNAQRASEKEFDISVPQIFDKPVENINEEAEKPVFAVPINWHGHKSILAIGIN